MKLWSERCLSSCYWVLCLHSQCQTLRSLRWWQSKTSFIVVNCK